MTNKLAIMMGIALVLGHAAHTAYSHDEASDVETRIRSAAQRLEGRRTSADLASLDRSLHDLKPAQVGHVLGHAGSEAEFVRWAKEGLLLARAVPHLQSRHDVAIMLLSRKPAELASAQKALVALHDEASIRRVTSALVASKRPMQRRIAGVLAQQSYLLHPALRKFSRSVLVRMLTDKLPELRAYFAMSCASIPDTQILAPIIAGLADQAQVGGALQNLAKMSGSVSAYCRSALSVQMRMWRIPIADGALDTPSPTLLAALSGPHGWTTPIRETVHLPLNQTVVLGLPGSELRLRLMRYKLDVTGGLVQRSMTIDVSGPALGGETLHHVGAPVRYGSYYQSGSATKVLRLHVAPDGKGYRAFVALSQRR